MPKAAAAHWPTPSRAMDRVVVDSFPPTDYIEIYLYFFRELKAINFGGVIAATAQFDDQVEELKAAGVHGAYNFYAEAGHGFAEHVCRALDAECQLEPEGT